jgi:DNA repair protein RecO (recombination protein O)
LGNIVKTRAIILNAIRWKESSKILTVYSEHLGKIKLIARSAYRNNSPFAGKIEALFLVDLIIDTKESRTLNVIKEVDIVDTAAVLRLNMSVYPYSLALMEIINQVLDEAQPDRVFFNFIVEMQNALTTIEKPQNVLIYFLLKLSSYLGFKPKLDKCFSGDFKQCAPKVCLSMSDGNISCHVCNKSVMSIITLKKEQFFYLQKIQKTNYKMVKDIKDSRDDFFEIIQILLRYANFHIDRELKTDSLKLLNSSVR